MPDFHLFKIYAKIFNETVKVCYNALSQLTRGYASFMFSAWGYTSRKRLGTAVLGNRSSSDLYPPIGSGYVALLRITKISKYVAKRD